MNELQVKGSTNFMGVELPNIVGGFGEGKKAILVREIAKIHGMKIGNINQRINENRNRFKDNIDIIDLNTSDVFRNFISQNNLFTSNRTKNIYLLSERGYAKLIKIMDTDLAWEIHDKLIDEYFQMKEVIKLNNQINSIQDFYDDLLNKMEINKEMFVEIEELENRQINAYRNQQINDLITTVTNLASTVNSLVSTIGNLTDATQKTQNKIEFNFTETSPKDKLDTVEKEIMNFTEETIRIQNFCDFINDKDVVPKRIGVQLVNQLLRDNGVYNKYNYPEENSPYFIRENTRNLLTKQGMLMLYKLVKDNIDYRYILRR